ncbi:heptahelical transmembrane protein 4-like [Macadamia integrifolia]|uniref:heptahelical transmembrane protein 4-like n=1 Tax=Macadamia integrifolia TaxID=60698 RepID=UPI001C4EAD3B|nr:heptahelical transmembrane protein 4-like [Macadamia integrifolia]
MGTNNKNRQNSALSSEAFQNGHTLFEREDENRAFCSKEGKGKRLWKKVKYQLVEYHSLPAYLKDNEFILGHYRSEWPLKQIFLSIFTVHNETLNVWTMQHGMKEDVANMIAPLLVRPITRWPFFAFLGGAMFCLLASSTCHLLSCHSQRLSYIMLRLDYAGIAALISTSFYPPVFYSFMCNPFFCNLYLGFISILGIATIIVSLLPVFQSPEFRGIRASLFFGMGMSGVAPILHKLILFRNQPEALHTTGYEILMGLFYGIGALVYATRIPERWKPGKFDIAGHSHQLFHVLVVAGAYTHYRAGLVYLRWRDLKGC